MDSQIPMSDSGTAPAPPITDGRTLRLMVLKPVEHPLVIRHCYHWSLFLQHVRSCREDRYHTRKKHSNRSDYEEVTELDVPQIAEADSNGIAQPDTDVQEHRRCMGCIPSIGGYGDGYDIQRGFHPLLTQGKEVYTNILVSHNVSAEDLDRICCRVNDLYPYSVLVNNCQNFAIRVMRQLATEGVITMTQFNDTWDACYFAIGARWRSIRNQPDLRLMQKCNCLTLARSDEAFPEGTDRPG